MKFILFLFAVLLNVELNAQSICTKIVPEKVERIVKRVKIAPERVEQVCVPATYSYEYETIQILKR